MSMPSNSNGISADRFALAPFADESVLLDLRRGAFYRINRVACRIVQGLLEGQSPEAVATDLALTYSLSVADAQRDVDAVLTQVLAEQDARQVNPISFTRHDRHFQLHWNGHALCWLDPDLLRLSLCPEIADVFLSQLQQILVWAAPHLLMLMGQEVLHAAAVAFECGVIGFAGASGVGKTTLAQTLAQGVASLVSEDLLLIDWNDSTPIAIVRAESLVRAWAVEHSPTLAQRGWIEARDLPAAREGSAAPLRALYFLDGARSTRATFERSALTPATALVELLKNGFAELGQPEIWQRLLRSSERLVHSTEMYGLKCPSGLEALRNVAPDYNWITKS